VVVRYLSRHGFRLAEQRTVQKLRLVVFRASRSMVLSRRALNILTLASTHPQVLIRGPGASYAGRQSELYPKP